VTTALVLGAGGITGVAWQIGLVIGLRRQGVDLGEVDRIVGTSAGALTGTLLATGVEPELAAEVEDRVRASIRPDWNRGAQAFALLNDASLDPAAVRAGVGALAAAAEVGAEDQYIASLAQRLPIQDWPAPGRLLITAVDTATGDPVVWDGDGAVPLVRAVAASCAVPCIFPPVTVDGGRYMDGGVRSYTNADLAADADVVLVIAPRLPLGLRRTCAEEQAVLRDTGRVTIVEPDEASTAAVGNDVFDMRRWRPTVAAGIAQGEALAPTIAALLSNDR
jgi:NTE family protein